MVAFEDLVIPVVSNPWTGTRGSGNVAAIGIGARLCNDEIEFRAAVMDQAGIMGISDEVAVRYLSRLVKIYDQRRREDGFLSSLKNLRA